MTAPTLPSVLRVLLVDDHAVVRTGCRRLMELEPDLRVVGELAMRTRRWTGYRRKRLRPARRLR